MTSGIALNLIANLIWAGLVVGGRRLFRDLDTADPRRRRRLLLGTAVTVFLVLIGALGLLAWSSAASAWGWPLVLAAAGWGVALALWEVYRFWRIGLLGADYRIRDGIAYDASLRLVNTQMSFLGTGAHKLTSSPEFDRALRRCRPDEPIRLLLRSPDDPTLSDAARRAGKPNSEYRDNVVASLRLIARLQSSIGNIQVRFYEGDLVFRILLIDRRLALVSFNVYGQGNGSELPQVHVADAFDGKVVTSSFFHAFERYFNERWRLAADWDFVAHL